MVMRTISPLLVLMSLACSPGLSADPPSEEAQAVEALSKLKSSVRRDGKAPGRPVIGVTLYEARDEDLAHLAKLPRLESLELYRAQVTDAGVAHLGRLTRLKRLRIPSARVSDRGLEALKGLEELRELDLSSSGIGPGLAHLKGLAKLEKLDLFHTEVKDRDLAVLAELKELRELNLGACAHLTDEGLAPLKGLTRLRKLELDLSAFDGSGLKYLEGATELRELSLLDTKVSGEALAQLKPLAKLEVLAAPTRRRSVTRSLAHLAGLKRLRVLQLCDTGVTDAGLAHLAKLTTCESLVLSDNAIGDAGLAHLKGLAKLRDLRLNDTLVGDKGLTQAGGPGRTEVCRGLRDERDRHRGRGVEEGTDEGPGRWAILRLAPTRGPVKQGTGKHEQKGPCQAASSGG